MPHRRSQQKYEFKIESWDEHKTDIQIANELMLGYHVKDVIKSEVIFAEETAKTVWGIIETRFKGKVPPKVSYCFDNHEFGDVLTWFPTKIVSHANYYA